MASSLPKTFAAPYMKDYLLEHLVTPAIELFENQLVVYKEIDPELASFFVNRNTESVFETLAQDLRRIMPDGVPEDADPEDTKRRKKKLRKLKKQFKNSNEEAIFSPKNVVPIPIETSDEPSRVVPESDIPDSTRGSCRTAQEVSSQVTADSNSGTNENSDSAVNVNASDQNTASSLTVDNNDQNELLIKVFEALKVLKPPSAALNQIIQNLSSLAETSQVDRNVEKKSNTQKEIHRPSVIQCSSETEPRFDASFNASRTESVAKGQSASVSSQPTSAHHHPHVETTANDPETEGQLISVKQEPAVDWNNDADVPAENVALATVSTARWIAKKRPVELSEGNDKRPTHKRSREEPPQIAENPAAVGVLTPEPVDNQSACSSREVSTHLPNEPLTNENRPITDQSCCRHTYSCTPNLALPVKEENCDSDDDVVFVEDVTSTHVLSELVDDKTALRAGLNHEIESEAVTTQDRRCAEEQAILNADKVQVVITLLETAVGEKISPSSSKNISNVAEENPLMEGENSCLQAASNPMQKKSERTPKRTEKAFAQKTASGSKAKLSASKALDSCQRHHVVTLPVSTSNGKEVPKLRLILHSKAKSSVSEVLDSCQRQLANASASTSKAKEVPKVLGPDVASGSGSQKGTKKRFPCAYCTKSFDYQYELKKHSLSHTGERPFQCATCHKRFSLKSNLNTHINAVHLGKRPFKCSICTKRFSQRGDLKRHMDMHKGHKPFGCSYEGCSFKCTQAGNLQKHIARTHVVEKRFVCAHCSATFFTKQEVKWHIGVHMDQPMYACPQCPRKFKHTSTLWRHKKAAHSSTSSS